VYRIDSRFKQHRTRPAPPRNQLGRRGALAAAWVSAAACYPQLLAAQSLNSDASADAQQARTDAILAMPGAATVNAQTNEFATAPGLEQQVRVPLFGLNVLAPLYFNSNAQSASSGGASALQGSPLVQLGFSSRVADLPVRFSMGVSGETERYANASSANVDFLRINARLQYVPPGNDQDYSPFIAYAPRLDFEPTFSQEFATRQDVNVGFNKVFNFGPDLERVPFSANSTPGTVWSFGFTAFAQQRFREPAPASAALVVLPSVAWIIAPQWNALFGIDLTRRWFEQGSRRDLLMEPIATLEYIIPEEWFGPLRNAQLLGRPTLDFQVGYEKNWSNVPGGTYDGWAVGAILKTGWAF
jgi:hypothetical protein